MHLCPSTASVAIAPLAKYLLKTSSSQSDDGAQLTSYRDSGACGELVVDSFQLGVVECVKVNKTTLDTRDDDASLGAARSWLQVV